MFVSLNKKIIYTMLLFFLLTAVIFVYTFYIVYGSKIQEEQRSNIQRSQQYLELLVENISYGRELQQIISENKDIHIDASIKDKIFFRQNATNQQSEVSRARKQIDELNKNYNERYKIIEEGIHIVIASTLLITLSVILLWALMQRWVLAPLARLAEVSEEVAKGNLSRRISLPKTHLFRDELDDLAATFNHMLNELEKNISEIKNKEAFLQSLIDSIPDGICVLDENYKIVIANKEYYRQTKAPTDCRQCFVAAHRLNGNCPKSMFTCPVHEIIVNKKNNIRVIQQFAAHPNRHLAINAAPMRLPDQTYVVEAIRDLSDDINFSHQQKLSSLGFLATSVAHEMKNHLGAIRMITERLLDKFYQDKPDNSEEKQHLNMIYNQLVECLKVPERLLKLSKISGDDDQIINCYDSIKEVVALLDFEAKSNGTVITVNAEETPLFVKGLEADFKMMAVNLILNALKAMKSNGVLTIDLSKKGKNVVISFTDNGVGIAEGKLNRIFEPFYSDGRNAQNKGTGLGLSIVKSIIEKFGGQIGVTSQIGIGSCFSVKIPATAADLPCQKQN